MKGLKVENSIVGLEIGTKKAKCEFHTATPFRSICCERNTHKHICFARWMGIYDWCVISTGEDGVQYMKNTVMGLDLAEPLRQIVAVCFWSSYRMAGA